MSTPTKKVSAAEKFLSLNTRDAHDKLRQCIVWSEGEWIYISGYGANSFSFDYQSVAYDEDGSPKFQRVGDLSKISEKDFSVGPYTLGMANYGNKQIGQGVYFLSRRPVRRNKFGLREDNCEITHVAGQAIDTRMSKAFGRLLHTNAMADMLKGVYPSFEECIDKIRGGSLLCSAFNRSFAVNRTGLRTMNLIYRTNIIGEVSITKGAIELYPGYGHMKERCELINGCPSVSVAPSLSM